MISRERNLVTCHSSVSSNQRSSIFCFWFTGLSSSGKSTLAYSIESELCQSGYNAFVLDGDNIRHGL